MSGRFIPLLLLALLPTAAAEQPAKKEGPNKHRLVRVPAGEYIVGAEGYAPNPRRSVKLAAFSIADAETTNAQFAAFVEATSYRTNAEKRGTGKVSLEGMADWAWKTVDGADWRHPFGPEGPAAADHPDHPVTQISAADAMSYCGWIGGRLPLNDEWEVAARAGATTLYPWGDAFDPRKANIWTGGSHRRNTLVDGFLYTSPVRSFPPNAWGLYDVLGNVFEYCADLPGTLLSRAGKERRLASGRGGSWWCSEGTCSAFNLRDIGTMDKHGSLANQGFRVVFDSE